MKASRESLISGFREPFGEDPIIDTIAFLLLAKSRYEAASDVEAAIKKMKTCLGNEEFRRFLGGMKQLIRENLFRSYGNGKEVDSFISDLYGLWKKNKDLANKIKEISAPENPYFIALGHFTIDDISKIPADDMPRIFKPGIGLKLNLFPNTTIASLKENLAKWGDDKYTALTKVRISIIQQERELGIEEKTLARIYDISPLALNRLKHEYNEKVGDAKPKIEDFDNIIYEVEEARYRAIMNAALNSKKPSEARLPTELTAMLVETRVPLKGKELLKFNAEMLKSGNKDIINASTIAEERAINKIRERENGLEAVRESTKRWPKKTAELDLAPRPLLGVVGGCSLSAGGGRGAGKN